MVGFREVTGSTLTEREANELAVELCGKRSQSIDYTSNCHKMNENLRYCDFIIGFAVATANKRRLITKRKLEQAFNLFDQVNISFVSKFNQLSILLGRRWRDLN